VKKPKIVTPVLPAPTLTIDDHGGDQSGRDGGDNSGKGKSGGGDD